MDNNFINKLNEKSKDLSRVYFHILQNDKEKCQSTGPSDNSTSELGQFKI